ncbi:hypothetical protein V8C26DRAFT_395484 [Trichoderma gracile]
MADAEGGEPERPSFTSFWKRVKQKEKGHEGDGRKKHGKDTRAEELLDEAEGAGAEQDESPDQNPDQDPGEFCILFTFFRPFLFLHVLSVRFVSFVSMVESHTWVKEGLTPPPPIGSMIPHPCFFSFIPWWLDWDEAR